MIHSANLVFANEIILSLGGVVALFCLLFGLLFEMGIMDTLNAKRARNNWYAVALWTMFLTLLIVFVLNTIAVNIR